MTTVTRESYQRSLDDLRSEVLTMGDLVADRVELALESLADGEEALATTVVEGDGRINETYLELEGRCVDLFALEQPVAGDLRFVTASFKILTDIERVGDLAVNLAQYAQMGPSAVTLDVAVGDIGRDAVALFVRSLAAYESGDVDAAREIVADDDRIDALCQRASEAVTRELLEREIDGDERWGVERLLDDVSRILLTIRDLERIADHAVNIAARTLYMVENDSTLIY